MPSVCIACNLHGYPLELLAHCQNSEPITRLLRILLRLDIKIQAPQADFGYNRNLGSPSGKCDAGGTVGISPVSDGLRHDVTTRLHAHNSIDILRTEGGSPAWGNLQGF
jgi:hypothetical protein